MFKKLLAVLFVMIMILPVVAMAAEAVSGPVDFSLTKWIQDNAELVVIPLLYAIINFTFSLYVNISDKPSDKAQKWKQILYSIIEVLGANMWGKAKQTGSSTK
jgi:hypothetical protein